MLPPLQFHPETYPKQSAKHPLPSTILLSSQTSGLSSLLFPQTAGGIGKHAYPTVGQVNPASILQVEEHPSDGVKLPSSHSSSASRDPSPHSQDVMNKEYFVSVNGCEKQ